MGKIIEQLDERLTLYQNGGSLTQEQEELRKIAYMCKDTSSELHAEIAKLRLDPQKGGWRNSLLKSVNTLKSRKVIDDLEGKLQKQSSLLQTRILTDLRIQQEAVRLREDELFPTIDHNLQQIVASLASGQTKVVDLLAALSTDLGTLIKQEGEEVRQEIKSHIVNIDSKVAEERKLETLLDSLRFTEINDRVNTIPKSHITTFEWIFAHRIGRSWDSFESWLASGNKLYWISGKPGSGKSVLIKFIVNHFKTTSLLDIWGGDTPVFLVSFFVWKGGAVLQRQKRGFLCSLVLQLVRQSEAYLSKVFINTDCSVKRSPADWSTEELIELLSAFAGMKVAKVCLFIDGLDECEASDDDIGMLSLIEWLASLEGWKVCAASRPEPEFGAVLTKYPKLRLQDLTENDLKRFATDSLQKVQQEGFLDDQDEQIIPDRLVKLVCDKADGVFLWVRFAVSTVLRGVRRMDGWEDLMKRLNKLPSELEELYLDMWRRSEGDQSDYSEEAARYFNMAILSKEAPLSCFDIMVSDSKPARDLLEHHESSPSLSHLLRDCRRIERRIVGCSRGFLEIQQVEDLTLRLRTINFDQLLAEVENQNQNRTQIRAFRSQKIMFVHRTVIDFLEETTVGHNLLNSKNGQVYDIPSIRTNARLVVPYYQFPFVDLTELQDLFISLCEDATSEEDKVANVRKFELVHKKIIQSNHLSESIDVTRNWVDTVIGGQWIMPEYARWKEAYQTVKPFQYAIGWRSYPARAGLVSYFRYMLSTPATGPLSSQYLSCLAACAAENNGYLKGSHTQEIQQLELLIFLRDLGADLNMGHLISFGRGLIVTPLTLFCMFTNRGIEPTEEERGRLLSRLKILLEHDIDYGCTSICTLYILMIDEGRCNGEFVVFVRAFTPPLDFPPGPGETNCFVELNLSALLRLYLQSIGASKEQTALVLKGRAPPPKCRLLGLQRRGPKFDWDSHESFHKSTAADVDGDSKKFYDCLDRCTSFGRFSYTPGFRTTRLSPEEKQANLDLKQTLDDIGDQTSCFEFVEHLHSLPEMYEKTKLIETGDVPLLQPSSPDTLDCSAFMFPRYTNRGVDKVDIGH